MILPMSKGTVVAVSLCEKYNFSKLNQPGIKLVKGLGVEGDIHNGTTVKHRSRIKKDPTQPNLRQVHLIHQELFDELSTDGFNVTPGQIGENITTRGVDLLNLPKGTILHIGNEAKVEITGLRNPCNQLNNFQKGLTQACISKDENGKLVLKAGIMGIVLSDGIVKPDDNITVELPSEPHIKLERV